MTPIIYPIKLDFSLTPKNIGGYTIKIIPNILNVH